MTWQTGRAEVEGLLEQGELDRVSPSPALADRLLDEAQRHLASAGSIQATDPSGSYQLAYDAARKACAALLAAQGLRATTKGGHVAVQDVVRAQFGAAFKQFPRLRRKRQESEYPDLHTPTVTGDDAAYALSSAQEIYTAAQKLLASGKVGAF